MPVSRAAAKPCPGCNLPRSQCWEKPCVHLRILLRGSLMRLQRWATEGGGRLVFDESPKARAAKTTRFWLAAGLLVASAALLGGCADNDALPASDPLGDAGAAGESDAAPPTIPPQCTARDVDPIQCPDGAAWVIACEAPTPPSAPEVCADAVPATLAIEGQRYPIRGKWCCQ